MSHKKKPISITLAAALVICIITFILGFVISSVAFLDSRLEAANEKNAELSGIISQRDAEIKELKKTIEQKDENNIILGEQIQTHLDTIGQLESEVSALKNDVDTISEAAINGELNQGSSLFATFAALDIYQQLILLLVILVIIILIISITCGIIASRASSSSEEKPRKRREKLSDKIDTAASADDEDQPEAAEAEASPEEQEAASSQAEDSSEAGDTEEPEMPEQKKSVNIPSVENAIDLLYRNNLEDNISRLGGFKFGITNFDEVLSDKSSSKSFGNSESGDFVAFMSTTEAVKKLYIIPRSMILSDSTVALRGITDLFNVTNEAGNTVTHGAVKIKEVAAPAVFACGENGWAIESKGEIVALGTKTL